jgi:hypothetical protein
LEKKRTGPQTSLAKENIRLNAVKHGLLAASPVIQGETEFEWQSHLAGLIESFQPLGYLELCLTESIAHLLWRLRRINRFETKALGGPPVVESLQAEPETAQDSRRTIEFQKQPPSTSINWPLPEDWDMERIQRYEGYTHRLLMKNLHEIEALQARRLGSTAPLLRLDVDGDGF